MKKQKDWFWNIMKGASLFLIAALTYPQMGLAKSGGGSGGWAVGGNLHIVTPSQNDINTLISRANVRASGISTPQMGSAWEFSAFLNYRFNSSILAIQFRPSFFMQSAKGSATNGDSYNYSLLGGTFMPILRWYLLESSAIRFFLNSGIGYGYLSGEVTEADFSVTFSGNNIGYMGGLGVEFCYDNHCCNIEGNIRYLFFERNLSSKNSGAPATGANAGIDQYDGEIEMDGRDLNRGCPVIRFLIDFDKFFLYRGGPTKG